jgi:uncharacterized iron-regulated membrane protein
MDVCAGFGDFCPGHDHTPMEIPMTNLRQTHRWSSTVAGAFLLVIAATGVALQIEELTETGERRGPPAPTTAAAVLESPETSIASALAGLRAAEPNARITSLALGGTGGAAQVVVSLAGETQARAIDIVTGSVKAAEQAAPQGPPGGPPPGFSLMRTIKQIHTGEIGGPFGQIIGLALGLTLLFLSISGLWMWLQMLNARANQGRKGWFW